MIRFMRHWPCLCLLMLVASWMTPTSRALAAAPAGFSCTATMSALNFGNVDPVSNIGLITTGSLTYTCTNTSGTARSYPVCFSIGDPHGAYYSNRWLVGGTYAQKLYFQIYQDAARSIVWGTAYSGGNPQPYVTTVAVPANGTTGPISVPVYAAIGSNQNVKSDTYTAAYGTGDTQIELGSSCTETDPATTSFPFTVTATTPKSCVVTASNLSFGTVAPAATNITGTSTIQVTCTIGAAYNVGLLPSNSNKQGAGVMSGTGGNTDKVPYQLNQSSYTGPIWGNTATSASKGNGVAGTGNGLPQSLTVYATAPGADYRPDTYTDTVTVTVNY